MPIATPEVYAEMLDRAKAGAFAYPAINCTSSQSIVAAMRGFAEAESDGIVQLSWGGAEFASGQPVKDMVVGAVALAEFAHVGRRRQYPVNIALHTDHCPSDKLDGFMRPLLDVSTERVAARPGAAVPVAHVGRLRGGAGRRTSTSPTSCSTSRPPRNIILEIEIGVVGGEEDGVEATARRQAVLDARGRRSRPPRSSASASAGATWSRRRSATCTASTSRATSC